VRPAPVAVAVAAAVAVVARRRVVAATVRGSSMAPTFHDGDRVYALRRARYRVGDVVVFDVGPPAPAWRIKRVTAVAGDPAPDWAGGDRAAGRRVPPGCLVVAGDNPLSQGSRQLGYIPVARVLGAVRVPRPGQKSSVAQGARSVPSRRSAVPSAPGVCSSTSPATASVPSRWPPR
jgi:signal peptidase I